jgi:cell division septal protein FtsQ
VFAVAFLVMVGFSFLPFWDLKQFVLFGCTNLSAKVVEKKLDEFLENNIWWVSLKKIRQKLSEIAAIENVHLKRVPPSKILVEIKERHPAAVIVKRSGQELIIDDKGVIIATANFLEPWQVNPFSLKNLPLVVGLEEKDCQNNLLDKRILNTASRIIDEFRHLLNTAQIKIDFGNRRKIIVFVNDSLPVILGDDSNLIQKIEVLKTVFPVVWKDVARIEYFDVVVPSCPIVKYRKGSASVRQ